MQTVAVVAHPRDRDIYDFILKTLHNVNVTYPTEEELQCGIVADVLLTFTEAAAGIEDEHQHYTALLCEQGKTLGLAERFVTKLRTRSKIGQVVLVCCKQCQLKAGAWADLKIMQGNVDTLNRALRTALRTARHAPPDAEAR